jgi:hypothetical protein
MTTTEARLTITSAYLNRTFQALKGIILNNYELNCDWK